MAKKVDDKMALIRYVATNPKSSEYLHHSNLDDIKETIINGPLAERLCALIYNRTKQCGHYHKLDVNTQLKIKLKTFALVADIEVKKNNILKLVEHLQSAGLKVLVLKGMAFNEMIYTSEAPRGTSDIDLLINKENNNIFEESIQALATKVTLNHEHTFDGIFEETWRANSLIAVFFDVHWYLSYPSLFSFDQEQIFKRSLIHPSYKSEHLRVLSHEDHLVYLAIHLMKDCNFYDYGLLDCHELICQYQPDLKECFKIAKSWGAKTSLYYLFLLAQQELRTPINNEVLSDNKPFVLKHWLCLGVIRYVFIIKSREKTNFHRFKQLVSVLLFSDQISRAINHFSFYLKQRFK
jgi:hypothetical protein